MTRALEISSSIPRAEPHAFPELAHSVHVEVEGLDPDRWYWYQFHSGAASSVVGRTRTAPAAGARLDRLRFAFASCQNWEQGYFTAYRHMAAEDLDLVVHLGDYIYEGPGRDNQIRKHSGPEIMTIEHYRNRLAQYKTDPRLQSAHAAFPWFLTWDDHEVDNNCANDIQEAGMPLRDDVESDPAADHGRAHESVRHRGSAVFDGSVAGLRSRTPAPA